LYATEVLGTKAFRNDLYPDTSGEIVMRFTRNLANGE
jgi:hypothetical protein